MMPGFLIEMGLFLGTRAGKVLAVVMGLVAVLWLRACDVSKHEARGAEKVRTEAKEKALNDVAKGQAAARKSLGDPAGGVQPSPYRRD
jgi:hypothetical protein